MCASPTEQQQQSRILWIVLGVNMLFFFLEITIGFLSKSMGLLADSLDMLADAAVYSMSLLAVGSSMIQQRKVAKFAGVFQICLALLGLGLALHRFTHADIIPDYEIMIIVSLLALCANACCLYLLHQTRSSEVHIQASVIFTSNDMLINVGVITSAVLVTWYKSNQPDLIVAIIVFLLVMRGAMKTMKLSN